MGKLLLDTKSRVPGIQTSFGHKLSQKLKGEQIRESLVTFLLKAVQNCRSPSI